MTAPLPPSSKTRAWVCAPGVLKVPFLSAFLPDYTLSALPGSSIEAVLGWGMKPTAEAGRRWAAKHGKPYIALEDGFLRSVGIGESGATSLSLIVDDLGVYYDATRPSRLEQLIDTAPDWCDAAMTARARGLIDRIVASGVSKTNMGGPLDAALLKPGRRVLIVDQTFGDASIGYGLATETSFSEMLATARRDEPDAQLIVKRHPAVAAGRKQGCIPASELNGVTLIDTDVRPADLLAAVDAVYVVTSALGFEALLRGLPVRCFGAPFYSGWGLTTDALQTGRRGAARDLEQIAAAALIAYTRYVDPVTGQRCEAEQALERLIALIEAGEPSPDQVARAEALRARVVEAGLSKYNLKGAGAPAHWPKDQPILLVVGQVENDRSILMGCGPDLRTNSGLVKAARADHPDAFLIYRNHPDVTAGNRPGLLDHAAMEEVDASADDLDIIDCLNACDRLATLTSLTGFEALMRHKPVSVYGRPFYAGWGLTDDRLTFERRTRRASLQSVIHAALIGYPVYVTPGGWPCEAEDLVEALIAARDHPLPAPPRGRINRWWRGVKASLDRSLPPAY